MMCQITHWRAKRRVSPERVVCSITSSREACVKLVSAFAIICQVAFNPAISSAALLAGAPVLPVHCVDDTFDLLDVLPFMASQPLRREQHGPLQDLSRPRNSRRT